MTPSTLPDPSGPSDGPGPPGPARVVIIGIGNTLMGDEGLGVLAVRMLEAGGLLERIQDPEGGDREPGVGAQDDGDDERVPGGAAARTVRLLEAGTLGVDVLALLEPGEAVVILDAVRGDGPPGTLYRIDLGDLPPPDRPPVSVHDLGVLHLLEHARLLSRPLRGVLLGIEPQVIEPRVEELSPPVAAALPALVEAACTEARRLRADEI
ncbi:MAG: hydrogenase maturation protease [bacterium]